MIDSTLHRQLLEGLSSTKDAFSTQRGLFPLKLGVQAFPMRPGATVEKGWKVLSRTQQRAHTLSSLKAAVVCWKIHSKCLGVHRASRGGGGARDCFRIQANETPFPLLGSRNRFRGIRGCGSLLLYIDAVADKCDHYAAVLVCA